MKHRKAQVQTLQDLEHLAEKMRREGRLPSLERLAAALHVVADEADHRQHRRPRGRRPLSE
jgi:hypothetical protein